MELRELKLNGDLGFLRVGAAVPQIRVADVDFNVRHIVESAIKAREEGVQVLALPELAISGYTAGDLFHHQSLLSKTEQGLERILRETSSLSMMIIAGMPLRVDHKVFNCAVVMKGGRILGVVPKTFLPNYKEFYEQRWFSSSSAARSNMVALVGQTVPFGTDVLFRLSGAATATIGIEICEDLWIPLSPHERQALAGASVLFNLSASNEILGKAEWRRTMIASESGRCLAGYCYVSSGMGESSNDLVYGGHVLMYENGIMLAESKRLSSGCQLVVVDFDVERLEHDRWTETTFRSLGNETAPFRVVETELEDTPVITIRRALDPHPFVPADEASRAERCRDILSMQVAALAQKLNGAGNKGVVIGVSGGLDSTLALLVAVRTMDFLGESRKNVHAFTLPGFGTTQRTETNATKLCHALGVSFERVDITTACQPALEDLGHTGKEDIVFENMQARYRTGFFFNKANELQAVVLGTGDLTEIALGWATFAGDQMSHYHINASIPKTLVQYLVRWIADAEFKDSPVQKVLLDILATPISPELLPPKDGKITQKSEDIIGPVELADFFLYPFVRWGMRPGKILCLADEVRRLGLFDGKYTLDDLHRWLQSFIRRFFANQFKRTCFPEGPKIGTVSLSPRGDWRMPSEASPALWLEDLERIYAKLRKATTD